MHNKIPEKSKKGKIFDEQIIVYRIIINTSLVKGDDKMRDLDV